MKFVTGLSEIVLIVSDVKAATKFYCDVVGLELERDPTEEWAWFKLADSPYAQRLALHNGSLLFEEHSPKSPDQRWGCIHFALHVPREKFTAAAEHLRSHGITLLGPTRFDWMKAESYYFYDLDGNLIEFWSPDP